MNKQSVILTKWVSDSNTLLEDYSQLSLLLADYSSYQYQTIKEREQIAITINQINQIIANSPVGTKWKLTLKKVE